MINELSKDALRTLANNESESNRDVIISYLQAEGDGIPLTDKQKELLERWSYADEMIRRNVGKKTREEIVNLIIARWSVNRPHKLHRATAYQDIVNAEYVFSSSTPLNKKYLIGLRIEFLERQIRQASLVPSPDYYGIAALEKALAKYIELYPDPTLGNQSPRNLIFVFNKEKMVPNIIDLKDADYIIDQELKKTSDG